MTNDVNCNKIIIVLMIRINEYDAENDDYVDDDTKVVMFLPSLSFPYPWYFHSSSY